MGVCECVGVYMCVDECMCMSVRVCAYREQFNQDEMVSYHYSLRFITYHSIITHVTHYSIDYGETHMFIMSIINENTQIISVVKYDDYICTIRYLNESSLPSSSSCVLS